MLAEFCISRERPLPMNISHNLDCEVRVVVCHRDLLLAINCIKTFYDTLQIPLPLYIHCDGTVTIADRKLLQRHLPFAAIVTPFLANRKLINRLRKYPYALLLRQGWQGIKLIDIPLLSLSSKVIILDADLYFFRTPTQIKKWILMPADRVSLFMRDYKHFSELSFSEFYQNIGIHRMTRPFNSGLLCFVREKYNIEFIEKVIKKIQQTLFERIRFDDSSWLVENRHLVEQTGYLALYSVIPARALGWEYVVLPEIKRQDKPVNVGSYVCIHFTGEMPKKAIYNEFVRNSNHILCVFFRVFRRIKLMVNIAI